MWQMTNLSLNADAAKHTHTCSNTPPFQTTKIKKSFTEGFVLALLHNNNIGKMPNSVMKQHVSDSTGEKHELSALWSMGTELNHT